MYSFMVSSLGAALVTRDHRGTSGLSAYAALSVRFVLFGKTDDPPKKLCALCTFYLLLELWSIKPL